MPKITFLGAGSTIFAKNVLGDCIISPSIEDLEISLFDIDKKRMSESEMVLNSVCRKENKKIKISSYLDRREALKDADFVFNAIQVGGYDPCTITDFEIPKKYGLRQTIGDTLGIGGIFRALRTIPVMEDIAKDIEKMCPNALFLNYSNPMAILTGYLDTYTNVRTVGLCHSVQVCLKELLTPLKLSEYIPKAKWDIAGINHQAWLLKIQDKDGNDLYPLIKERAKEVLDGKDGYEKEAYYDLIRYEMMLKFGYYTTESSEHLSEYLPWFIKSDHPELIERYNIPLDEYPRRCMEQIESWDKMRDSLIDNPILSHEQSREFASHIVSAVVNDKPYRIHANVLNNGLIDNLPSNACVEVPCMVDGAGVHPIKVGNLPEQCAAINRTNINVSLLTMKAAKTRRKEDVYMAAMLDPHMASELTLDEIKDLCDDLFDAHGKWIPEYK